MRRFVLLCALAGCDWGWDWDDDDGCNYPNREFTYAERFCIEFAAGFGGCCDLSSSAAAHRRLLAEEVGPLLALPRTAPALTMLLDGRVLAAGGRDAAGEPVAHAELVDLVEGRSEPLVPMGEARAGQLQILLDDGRVLVAGGFGAGVALASSEIFDPEMRAFLAAVPMHRPPADAEAFRLTDGSVLLIGGDTADVYDPAADTWALVR